jgi:hypothetical protein
VKLEIELTEQEKSDIEDIIGTVIHDRESTIIKFGPGSRRIQKTLNLGILWKVLTGEDHPVVKKLNKANRPGVKND